MLRERANAVGKKTNYHSKLMILTVDANKNPELNDYLKDALNIDADEEIIRKDLNM